MKIAKFIECFQTIGRLDERANLRGNEVRRMSVDTTRYVVDFASDFAAEGWEQFDTDQDADYFGVWVNRGKLLTLTYAEGDWDLVTCADAIHYNAELASMIAYYGEGSIATVFDLDAKSMTTLVQDRSKFLIQEGQA